MESGSRILPVLLKFERVVETTDLENWIPTMVAEEIEDLEPSLAGKLLSRLTKIEEGFSEYVMRPQHTTELREALLDNGVDAIRYQNQHEGDGGWSYIALRENSVRPLMSGADSDFMFSIGDSPPPPEPPPPLHADMEAVDRWGVLRDMIIACRG